MYSSLDPMYGPMFRQAVEAYVSRRGGNKKPEVLRQKMLGGSFKPVKTMVCEGSSIFYHNIFLSFGATLSIGFINMCGRPMKKAH